MKYRLICLLVCLICCSDVFAQSRGYEVGFKSDDDSYLGQGTDRYYTAGNFLYFRHALPVNDNSSLENKVLGFEAGQQLYTPHSGDINFTAGHIFQFNDPKYDNPKYIDRPFAAYLYVGSTLNLLYKNEGSLKLAAQIGVVGPSAFGKQVQDFVHSTLGLYHPSGWEYQVENGFELNLSAEYDKLIARASWIDLSLTSYGNLGNGFTGAGLGPLIRLGDFNQLFNSLSTQSSAMRSSSVSPLHSRELFFYYQPQLNLVVYDATVQGGMFTSRPAGSIEVTLTPEHFVMSNQLGVGYSGKYFGINAAVIFHTKDVEQMRQSHQWASITFLYRFN
jgi:lipid A 3-O-deacylase